MIIGKAIFYQIDRPKIIAECDASSQANMQYVPIAGHHDTDITDVSNLTD